MSSFTQFCGIDVSKDRLDYQILGPGLEAGGQRQTLLNECEAIRLHFEDASFAQTLFILEFTGPYSAKPIHVLSGLNRAISLVSPLQSHSYMNARGVTNKNDRQAAYCLALMGQQMNLRLYQAPSVEVQKRKQLLSTVQALKKQQRMLQNQLHALAQLPVLEQGAQAALQAVLETVEAQLEPLQKQLYDPAQDEDFNEKKRLATSVVGIGDKTAEALLLVTNGLNGFDSPDQLSRFLGLTPQSHSSGSSVRRKGGITKFGSSDLRSLLYMCTRSAIRYNRTCREQYERLRAKGKPHKVAAVAVMHRLVIQIYACVTTKTDFDNNYQPPKKNIE